jgi:cysteine desulfurase/selenocysteine lyase
VQHDKLNVDACDLDFAVFSMHKILGPTGVGILFGKNDLLNKICPNKLGGGMNDEVDENKYTFAPIPEKFEGGTPNIAGIIGSKAAIDFINKIGFANIKKNDIMLKNYLNKQMESIKNIDYVSENSPFAMCSFNIKNIYPQDLAVYLNKHKIIVRSGVSCVKLQHKLTCEPGGYVRASF